MQERRDIKVSRKLLSPFDSASVPFGAARSVISIPSEVLCELSAADVDEGPTVKDR